MKFCLCITIVFLVFSTVVGQQLEIIIITAQQADEPPTKQGRPEFTIELLRRPNGDFRTSFYRKDKNPIRLENDVIIRNEKVEQVFDWQDPDNRIFTLKDLDTDLSSLKSSRYNNGLHFELPDPFIVEIDSFQFCQQFKLTKSYLIGGETITVRFVNDLGEQSNFIFSDGDYGQGNFNLKNYLLCYLLINDIIPKEFPSHEFFSEEKLLETLINYQKTVECEDYYYQEYVRNNPYLTPQQRRTKEGWDFVEYLNSREGSR